MKAKDDYDELMEDATIQNYPAVILCNLGLIMLISLIPLYWGNVLNFWAYVGVAYFGLMFAVSGAIVEYKSNIVLQQKLLEEYSKALEK